MWAGRADEVTHVVVVVTGRNKLGWGESEERGEAKERGGRRMEEEEEKMGCGEEAFVTVLLYVASWSASESRTRRDHPRSAFQDNCQGTIPSPRGPHQLQLTCTNTFQLAAGL